MADEELLPVRPSYNAISGVADYARPPSVRSDEFESRVVGQPAVTFAQKAWHSLMNETDPTFNKWKGIEGYEEYADELLSADSQGEQDGIKQIIDTRKFQRATEANGQLGIMGDLMAETLNPINYIPIPAVRGIGFLRAAAASAGLNVAQTVVEEGARQWSDPTATWQESLGNVGFSAVLGGAIGGVAGSVGARAASRRAAAARVFDAGLGDGDALSVSLAIRGVDEDLVPIYERPFEVNGTVPKIAVTLEPKGFKMGTVDRVNYVWSPDHDRWIKYSDQGRDVPDLLPEEITDQLGAPEPVMERVMRVDDARHNRDYNEGQWHDEIESYREDGDVRPAGEIIRNRKDHLNFRMREHLWAQQLERGVDEPIEDFNIRVGKQALKEMEATKVAGGFAGNAFVKWAGEALSFSPMLKAMTVSGGDNVVTDTVLRVAHDYGFGLKANEFGMSAPPSVLLKGLRHTVRWQQFRAVFDQEWVKFVSGQQESTGRIFQNANVTAQMYALKAGARRRLGANVLDYHTFSEMVGRAVFDKSEFTHKGFPVNQHIRTAAKEYTRMMQEYDALQREAGVFRTQKNLQRDIRLWSKDAANYQHRVNEWLWGETGTPNAYQTAVRIRLPDGSVRIFIGQDHSDAVSAALDALGDEGVPVVDAMTLNDYGYVPRQRARASKMVDALGAIRFRNEVFTAGSHADAMAKLVKKYGDDPEAMAEIENLDIADFGRVVGGRFRGPEFDYRIYQDDLKKYGADVSGFRPIDADINLLMKQGLPYEQAKAQVIAGIDRDRYPGWKEAGRDGRKRDFGELQRSTAVKPDDRFVLQKGGTYREPGSYPAVKYKGEVFVGDEHIDAVKEAIAKYPEFEAILDADPEAYIGYQKAAPADREGRFRQPLVFDGKTYNSMAELHEAMSKGSTAVDEFEQVPWDPGIIDDLTIRGDDLSEAEYIDEQMEAFLRADREEGLPPVEGREFVTEAPYIDEDFIDLGDYSVPAREAEFEQFGTITEALGFIEAKGFKDINRLIRKIRPLILDVKMKMDTEGKLADNFNAIYDPQTHEITLTSDNGTNIDVVLHEALHAATYNRIAQGIQDLGDQIITPHGKVVADMIAMGREIRELIEKQDKDTNYEGLDLWYVKQKASHGEYDEHEILTYALTSQDFRRFLRQYKAKGETLTGWQKVKKWIGDLLGLSKKERTLLDEVLELNDRLLETPVSDTMPYGVPKAYTSRPDQFVDLVTMTRQRVDRLSPRQLEIYNQKRQALDQVNENIRIAEEQLQTVTDTPYLFVDANGNPEDYFNRYWNPSALVANRAGAEYLITKWYEREGNTATAAANAAETVQKMIDGDAGGASNLGSVSHLNRRALNIPNSFSVEHPELGTIRVSDFINLNVLATSEHYISTAGRQIELARMFGDVKMVAEFAKIREHLVNKGMDPAQIEEIEDHIRNTRDIVAGTFKERDPWALDNRFARTATDLASLSMLGKAAITSMVDLMHAPMAQGFGVFFSHVFRRMFDDVAEHGEDMRMGGLTNELFDFAGTQHNARASMMEHGQPDIGGTWLENLIHDRLPGFFKINGLTSLTVWLKTLVMDAAQHNVMADAIRISDVLKAGGRLTREDTFRLAALGIKPRDAVLLASMPHQTWKNGTLILPNTGAWTGRNGARAKELLLNAIHAEARRAIVTPSIGDQSTIFRGVFTVKGKKVEETDLMKIPMQFLGYSVAAHNKILVSALQGRDRDRMMGMISMVMMAFVANYLKTDSNSWKAKKYDDVIFEAVQQSGLLGFWFGDLNTMLEKASNERLGIRPNLIRPLTGTESRSKKGDLTALASLLGAAPSRFWDSARAFVDPESRASDYASAVRKIVPYNNVLWWERFFRDMTGEVAGTFEGERR